MPLLLVDMDSHAVRACNRAFEMWCDRPKPGAVLADVTGLDAARWRASCPEARARPSVCAWCTPAPAGARP